MAKIVFTNGCFDILHLGHIKLFEECKKLGSRLIVGMNSDKSVRRLKGEDRPFYNEEQRKLALEFLDLIDEVIIFDEDTPLRLIEKVRPDIIVKGSDYKKEDVVGKKYVESYDGEVHLVDLLEGYSTTNIINSMNKGDE